MNGKHVVITGGGSGSGSEIARQFNDLGANVTIIGRSEDVLKESGHFYQVADVTDHENLAAAFDAARTKYGPVEIVVANAGAASSTPFSKTRPGDFDKMLGVNLIGVFNTWQAALPDMLAAGGGRMIAIASTAGLKGYAYVAPYCAAKHGVIGLTKSLAIELAKTGITVNAICPGFMETPLLNRSIENIVEKTGLSFDDAAKSLRRNNPQGRFIQSDEVAGMAIWLCSKAARSVNGQALSISGGEI